MINTDGGGVNNVIIIVWLYLAIVVESLLGAAASRSGEIIRSTYIRFGKIILLGKSFVFPKSKYLYLRILLLCPIILDSQVLLFEGRFYPSRFRFAADNNINYGNALSKYLNKQRSAVNLIFFSSIDLI